MREKRRRIADLLVSVSGVMVFLSLAHFIDINGFSGYSPILMLAGILLLFWPEPLLKILAPLRFISKQIVLTISHILVFLGLKTYLASYVDTYWAMIFIIGVILINTNKDIAERLVRHK
jgi:hypothetical protein